MGRDAPDAVITGVGHVHRSIAGDCNPRWCVEARPPCRPIFVTLAPAAGDCEHPPAIDGADPVAVTSVCDIDTPVARDRNRESIGELRQGRWPVAGAGLFPSGERRHRGGPRTVGGRRHGRPSVIPGGGRRGGDDEQQRAGGDSATNGHRLTTTAQIGCDPVDRRFRRRRGHPGASQGKTDPGGRVTARRAAAGARWRAAISGSRAPAAV